jgi:hypothetical protein
MTDEIVFILKGYPRLSETFIAQEIRALEQRGIKIRIVSLRFPTDKHVHPVHREIQAPVAYLPEYLHQEPLACCGLVAGAAVTGICRRIPAMDRRPPPRFHHQPRPAVRPGLRAGGRAGPIPRHGQSACMRISSYAASSPITRS